MNRKYNTNGEHKCILLTPYPELSQRTWQDPMKVNNVDYREHLPVSEQCFATFQKGTERYETKKMLKGVGEN